MHSINVWNDCFSFLSGNDIDICPKQAYNHSRYRWEESPCQDRQNAEKYAKDLRKAYRFEFKSRAKRGRFPMSAFRFYPLKFDSLNMKQFQLGKFIKETGNGKLYELYARSP